MPEIVRRLAAKYHLTIISSAKDKTIKKFLKKHKVIKYFNDILGYDSHTSKIEKIRKIIKKYKAGPKNCLFITDTLGDIIEAEKCRVKSLAVIDGFHPKSILQKGKPAIIIKDRSKIIPAINKFFHESK